MQTVYTSAALCRHPETFNAIADALAKLDIPHHSLAGTDNIWCRDFMPVPTAVGLVKFGYTNYGYRKLKHLRVPDSCWNFMDTTASPINLDGGNVEEGEEKVLICDMVFRKNRNMTKIKVVNQLENTFQKEIVFLPCEPDDTLGHADGTARFCSKNVVLVNDYSCRKSKALTSFQTKLEKTLSRNKLEAVRMPYAYDQCPHLSRREFKRKYPYGDDQNEATGYYCNFLVLPKVVLVPQFGLDYDTEALTFAEMFFPNRRIVGIPCFDVSQLGGCVSCVTWVN